jgi:hypothetical protein
VWTKLRIPFPVAIVSLSSPNFHPPTLRSPSTRCLKAFFEGVEIKSSPCSKHFKQNSVLKLQKIGLNSNKNKQKTPHHFSKQNKTKLGKVV